MMVRFICLLLLLLFSTAWLTTSANAHEAEEDRYVSPNERDGNVATRNEVGRRKMIPILKRVEITEGNNVGEVAETTLKISSANHQGMDAKKKKMMMKKKNRVVKNGGRNPSVGQFRKELNNEARFVAFNADYHAPRHHPPKNN